VAERVPAHVRLVIADLLDAGHQQVDIAQRVGVSQSVVSHVHTAMRQGHGPREELGATLAASQRRTRSQILLEAAALKADTVRAATRALLDVAEADGWVTDPHFAADLANATSTAVTEALSCLAKVADHLREAHSPAAEVVR